MRKVTLVLVSVGPERTQTIERAYRPMRHRTTLMGPAASGDGGIPPG